MRLPSLLITDDDRDFRETLRGVFEPRGFQTLLARDGEEALEIVTSRQVHVVLMDLQMPRLDGLQAIRRIRQIDRRLPCILISAAVDERKPPSADVFCVLVKPVSFRQVTQSVHDAIRQTYQWELE